MEILYRKNSALTKQIVDKIDGLEYHPNFLTNKQHEELVDFLGQLEYDIRGSKYFGLDYNHKKLKHDKEKEDLPEYLNLLKPLGLKYDQLVIQHFRKDDGHNFIKESELFQDNVIVIVIGSSFVYHFKKDEDLILDFLVEPRSLLLISGKASDWYRKINRRVKERFNKCVIPRKEFYLLTFRKIQ